MRLRPVRFVEWIFSILAFIIFVLLLITAAYVFLPFPSRYFGLLPMTGSILHPLFVYVALLCLVAYLIFRFKKWLWTSLLFLCSMIIAAAIAIVPMIQLLNAATEYNVKVSVAGTLFYKKNKGDMSQVQTVTYLSTQDGQQLRLDVWPATFGDKIRPKPAILKVHGGGWSHGKRSDMSGWNSWLNSLGYTVFDIDYRLSPPARWNDAAADVKCALAWIAEHAQQYQVDTSRIVLMGYSAGAHLALLTAFTNQSEGVTKNCNLPGLKIKGVIDIYGPTDLISFYNESVSEKYVHDMLQQFIGGSPEKYPQGYEFMSPVNHVNRSSPPTIIIHGKNDRIVPYAQSIALFDTLVRYEVPAELYLLPSSDHGFDFHWNGIGSQIAREKIKDFLQKYCPN